MNPLFPDKLWNYKNFNMVTELDIAGEFIYDGMHTFNQLEVIDQDPMFEFKDIKECFDIIEGLMNGDYDYKEFTMQFPKKLELVEGECPPEVLNEIFELCSNYLSKNTSDADFIQQVKNHYISFEECYNFESE